MPFPLSLENRKQKFKSRNRTVFYNLPDPPKSGFIRLTCHYLNRIIFCSTAFQSNIYSVIEKFLQSGIYSHSFSILSIPLLLSTYRGILEGEKMAYYLLSQSVSLSPWYRKPNNLITTAGYIYILIKNP